LRCSPRHRLHCSPGHARLVGDYRDARDARDMLRESGEFMQMEDDDFAAAYPPVTFKAWLIGNAGRNRLPSEGDSPTPY
jgi:hypothetical protein